MRVETTTKIYREARIKNRLTQEQAAELFSISVDSLRLYEAGKRIPSDEVALKMIEEYNEPYLAYFYITQKTKVIKKVFPDVIIRDMSESVLLLEKGINDYKKVNECLYKIALQNKITKNEAHDYMIIVNALNSIMDGIMSLKFATETNFL